jgi:hypothetical protein
MNAASTVASPLEALVREAAKVQRSIRELTSLAGQKLAASAYVREAMEIAKADANRLKKLRAEIEDAQTSMQALNGALRLMVRAVRSPNFPTPPRSARPLRYMLSQQAEAQLAKLAASPFELFAIAAQIAAEKHPEDFGKAQSSDAHEAQLFDLTQKRDQLYGEIATTYGPNDLVLWDWGEDGKCRAAFALSKGAVSIAPRENAAQRLVDWYLANEKVMA